ncbi:S8 family serine peptidase [Mycoplasma sp. 1012]
MKKSIKKKFLMTLSLPIITFSTIFPTISFKEKSDNNSQKYIEFTYNSSENEKDKSSNNTEFWKNKNLKYISKFAEKNKLLKFEFSLIEPKIWVYGSEKLLIEFIDKELKNNLKINKFSLKNIVDNFNTIKNYIPDYYKSEYKQEQKDSKYNNISFEKLFKLIEIYDERQKENNSNLYIKNENNIGIMETRTKDDQNNLNINNSNFKNRLIVAKDFDKLDSNVSNHGTNVTSIATENEGIDRFSSINYANFSSWNEWRKKIEWLILERKVKVINHSYGTNGDNDENEEAEEFLNTIARKYGIINVFSSGNNDDERETENEFINSYKKAYNNIVVGSSYYDFDNNIMLKSDFSNYLLHEKDKELPHPLLVVPGETLFLNDKPEKTLIGTSYSAPIVTGVISLLMRTKDLDFGILNPLIYKSILTTSADTEDYNGAIVKNTNGLDKKIGAGLIKYSKILDAKNNLKTVSIPFEDKEKKYVLTSENIHLNKGETLQASIAWSYNAGLLKEEEKIPEVGWWEFWNYWKKDDWNKKHISSKQLKKEETIKRQNNLKFSNYNLILEKKLKNNTWDKVVEINSKDSNVEFIRYKVNETGDYRLRVLNKESALFKNSVDDLLALSYVKK